MATPNWLNVKEPPFNAAGDGLADDRAAIQAAIDQASQPGASTRVVYLPQGTYKVMKDPSNSWGLNMNHSDLSLIGDGQTSILQSHVTDADFLVLGGFTAPTPLHRNLVANLRIRQMAVLQTVGGNGAMVSFQNMNESLIRDVDIITPYGSNGGFGHQNLIGVGIYFYSNVIRCVNVNVRALDDFPDPTSTAHPTYLTGFQLDASVPGSSVFTFDNCSATPGRDAGDFGTTRGWDLLFGESVYLRNCEVSYAHIGFHVRPGALLPSGAQPHILFWGIEGWRGGDACTSYVVVQPEDPQAYVNLGYIRNGLAINWFGTAAGAGILVDPNGGTVHGLQIAGNMLSGSGGHGIRLRKPNGGDLKKVGIQNCLVGDVGYIGLPSDGVLVEDGVSDFLIEGCILGGNVYGTPWNRYGVNVAGAGSDHFAIVGNLLEDNASGPLQDLSTGTDRFRTSNVPFALPSAALAVQLDDTAVGQSKGRLRAPYPMLATEAYASLGADSNFSATVVHTFAIRRNGSIVTTVTINPGAASAAVAITPAFSIAKDDRLTIDHASGANEGGAVQIQLRGKPVEP